MKVFLSWSGEHSQAVAKAFHEWLPQVIQQVDPFISTDSLSKGETWLSGIREALSASNGLGLFFLTKEALSSSWLLYEAGGIAAIGQQRVCTVCVDVDANALKPPLSFFQATVLERSDILKLLESLNAYCQPPLTPMILRKSFDRAWPELESALDAIAKVPRSKAAPKLEPAADVASTAVLDALRRIEARIGTIERQQSYIRADTVLNGALQAGRGGYGDYPKGSNIVSLSKLGIDPSSSTPMQDMVRNSAATLARLGVGEIPGPLESTAPSA